MKRLLSPGEARCPVPMAKGTDIPLPLHCADEVMIYFRRKHVRVAVIAVDAGGFVGKILGFEPAADGEGHEGLHVGQEVQCYLGDICCRLTRH